MSVPECTQHDGDSMDPAECDACAAWCDAEAASWLAYFGGPATFVRLAQDRRDERECHGRELSDEERMDEARRMKR